MTIRPLAVLEPALRLRFALRAARSTAMALMSKIASTITNRTGPNVNVRSKTSGIGAGIASADGNIVDTSLAGRKQRLCQASAK
jgi:hypothetical protein